VATLLKRPEAIQEILAVACARNELLILVTPFLRFESHFVALGPGELQVAATMDWDDAAFGLRSPELKIRFPMALGFMEAPVKLLGLGLHAGRRTLRLELPRQIQENDHRAAYRVERVGRVQVTYGTDRGDLLQGALVDLSSSGARIHTQQDLEGGALQVGARLALSIPLDNGIHIEARGEIRHVAARNLGLEFVPELPEPVQVPLTRWIFQRREEDQERLALRMEQKDRHLMAGAAAPSGPGAPGILLISGDAALEEALRPVFQPLVPDRSFVRIPLSLQALKDALRADPPLVVFHVAGTRPEERRRLKALVELAGARVPVLLLGTDLEAAPLFELSGAWKTASALVWNPARGPFLQRLAQGIIRRSHQGGDAPMAPAEP
jgi:hypothetical protein